MNDIVTATDTYLSFLLSLSKVSPMTIISLFFLILARVIPIMTLAPFLGAKIVLRPARIGFALPLSFILLPPVILITKTEIGMSFFFMALMLKEVLIGLILGFVVSIPFFIAQSSGGLIDHIRGASSLQITDPTTQATTGPMGMLYNYVLIATFFSIGGPFLFFQALANSYFILPADKLIDPNFFSLNIPFWQMILGLLTQILTISIQLGAPALIGILMSEMFLGIANRLAPQVQIVFLGISLKSWVGIALLAVSWYFILQQLNKHSLEWIEMMNKTMNQITIARF